MKILLACLMCGVLATSECFAIDGGPWSGGGTQVTVTGNYAGVLVPLPTVLDPGPPPVTLTDNSLALFTMSIPKVGLATGTSAVFRNGIFYTGTITGLADPDSAKLTGIIDSKFIQASSTTTSTTTTTSTDITEEYDGNGPFLNTKIVPNSNGSSSTTARIRGQASLTYKSFRSDGQAVDPAGNSGGAIIYKVRAFKQSEASG